MSRWTEAVAQQRKERRKRYVREIARLEREKKRKAPKRRPEQSIAAAVFTDFLYALKRRYD